MRALTFTVGALAAAALVAALPGCGGREKKLPDYVAPIDTKDATPAVVAPDKSEPAAAAVVERAIKAATDGHPERLEKVKVNRLAMKGMVMRLNGTTETTRKVEGVWADRMAVTDDFKEDEAVQVLMRLRRPVLWIAKRTGGKTTQVEFPDIKAFEAAFAAESVARHWMQLLVPLADPKTVVFDAKKVTASGQAFDVLKAFVPGCPVFTLWFDEKTGHLNRIDFAHLEPTTTVPKSKVFWLGLHRSFDGITAPGKVAYRENERQVEEWTIGAWEFPEKLDDAGFDAPK